MYAYDMYMRGEMKDSSVDDNEIKRSLEHLPVLE